MIKRTAARQRCPICGTLQPNAAVRCEHCGALLAGAPTAGTVAEPTRVSQTTRPMARTQPQPSEPPTDAHLNRVDRKHAAWDDGESDLHEGSLNALPWSGLLVLLIALVVVIGGVWALSRQNAVNPIGPAPSATPLPPQIAALASGTITGTFPAATPSATIPPTNTRSPSITPAVAPPSLGLATVTPQPPTPTITPTRGPCVQKARQGDTLSALAARCGEYAQAVIPTILDMNNMTDAAQLQIGQSILIPWPTATGGAGVAVAVGKGTPTAPSAPNEPTLPPGVTWYTVLKGDNAISIAYKFRATIKILHDLNPEIASDFSQCDYGQPAGGQSCNVRLSEGERVRVPIPLPTATRSPTPNGSETATPLASPTFNAPYVVGPGDNMLFGPAEFPVLRWGASGALLPGQVYFVTVQDVTANVTYHVTTTDTSLQVSYDWQPTDGTRHIYNWSVSVATQGANGTPTPAAFVTETRMFTWQGP